MLAKIKQMNRLFRGKLNSSNLFQHNFKYLNKYNFSSNHQTPQAANKNYKVSELTMPVIYMDKFMNRSEGWEKECKTLAECLNETGIMVVKDKVK